VKNNRQRRGAEGGFTLIELMVVVVILGILAALVVPQLVGATDDAKVAAAKAQVNNFKTALDLYKLNPNLQKYPTSAEGLEALITNGVKNFLDQERIPMDPWGNPYMYRSPGEGGRSYEIVSYGEDGVKGGSGYAADIESWDLSGAGRE
jgi:general secretion pathway protein G